MKTLLLEVLRDLILAVHKDVVTWIDPGILRSRAYSRDRKYLATASEPELLQELPVVGKNLDRHLCLAQEECFGLADDASLTLSQAKRFPYLLEGVRGRDAACIKAFRQIHLLYAKYEYSVPADEAIRGFVQRQQELPTSLPRTPLLMCARDLVSRVLSHVDWEDIIPRHGPGSTATGEKPWEKMDFKRIYLDLQRYYPADQYFFMNVHHLSDALDGNEIPFVELPDSHCKIVAVPKDFRGPRIIAMEPLEKQWIQQGQRRILVRRLESHSLTRGYVNFTSQDVNRSLALRSSVRKDYSTLDLKDASDRVSCALCDSIIEEPAISYLRASRSVGALLPSGEVVMLRSFSPMGSAVCFPLESLVFYALSLSAVHLARRPECLFPRSREWKEILGAVYVYGDDLVVDSRYSQPVIDALTSVGLVVNRDKCCLQGSFRESCGLDAYNGQEIQPVRVKHLPDHLIPSTFPSSCSYLNMFRQRRMMNSYDSLIARVANEFGTVPYLTCHDDPCGIITTSFTEAAMWNHSHFPSRWNKRLQEMEWRVTSVSPRYRTHAIPGWSQYLRVMTANPYGMPSDWSKDDDEWSIPHALQRNQRWRTL